MLVVWCFIAGFSERLIPGLLAKTEGRLETSPASDRYRPSSAGSDSGNGSGPTPTTAAGNGQQATATKMDTPEKDPAPT